MSKSSKSAKLLLLGDTWNVWPGLDMKEYLS
jgi:hypothetical protein